jgi:glutathione S-transferase
MLALVIGNKNLSSWSLRPWLLLKHLGIGFREIKLILDTPTFAAQIAAYSPAGRVPVLVDGDRHIWDSLAICEYANERAQGRGWPADAAARAHARSISAEMHSGFSALRESWPMNTVGRSMRTPASAAVARDVERIERIWTDCRARYGSEGPWLCGRFSIADAMYAPVALRFNTYDAALAEPAAREYLRHVLDDRHVQQWMKDAEEEVGT